MIMRILIFLCLLVLPVSAQSLTLENIGYGADAGVLRQILGPPESYTKPVIEAATGEYAWQWNFPAKGLTFYIESPTAGRGGSIRSVVAKSPSVVKTKAGLQIGDSEAQARKLYPSAESFSEGYWASMDFKEHKSTGFRVLDGKVVEMSVGSMGE